MHYKLNISFTPSLEHITVAIWSSNDKFFSCKFHGNPNSPETSRSRHASDLPACRSHTNSSCENHSSGKSNWYDTSTAGMTNFLSRRVLAITKIAALDSGNPYSKHFNFVQFLVMKISPTGSLLSPVSKFSNRKLVYVNFSNVSL